MGFGDMRFDAVSIRTGTLASNLTTTNSTELVAAPGASRRLWLKSILITNSHAATSTVVKILSGSTTLIRLNATAGGGFVQSDFGDTPIPLGVNEALNIQCETGATVQAAAVVVDLPKDF